MNIDASGAARRNRDSSTSRNSQHLPFYQRCLSIIDRLSLIPGFRPNFLDTIHVEGTSTRKSFQPSEHSGLVSIGMSASQSFRDPVKLLWNSFRQGAGLCFLVNLLYPKLIKQINPPIDFTGNKASSKSEPFDSYKNNLCKRNVYQFLVACKEDAGIPQDQLFNLSEIYDEDTNGLVKVIKCVEILLTRMEEVNILPKNSAKATSRENSWILQSKSSPVKPSPTGSSSKTGSTRISDISGRVISAEYDHRVKIIVELLLTERKYVTDLEVMQEYVKEAETSSLIPKDVINDIFSNLNQLVDFQRKFLIDLEECIASDLEYQIIGALFIKHEEGFLCYQRYCANHKKASEVILEKKDLLSKVTRLDAVIELPSYMIKPIQRICKYPLLVNELIKATATNHPDYSNLQEALIKVKRMTELVNESNRRQENMSIVAELKKQVDDWRNHDINKFGDLLLEERIVVASKEVEKELHVFLFEKILVMFKEATTQSLIPRRRSKILQLRGNIYLREVTKISPHVKDNEFHLKIYWCSNRNEGDRCFSLKFRNEEKLNQWSNAVAELLPRLNRYYGSSSTVNYQVASSTAQSRDISRSTSMDQVAISDSLEEKRRNLKEKGVSKSESAHSLFNGSDSSRGSRSNGKSLDALNDELDRVINEVQSETESVNEPMPPPPVTRKVFPGQPPNIPLPPVPSANARDNLRKIGGTSEKMAANGDSNNQSAVQSFQDKRQAFDKKSNSQASLPPTTKNAEKGNPAMAGASNGQDKRMLSLGSEEFNLELRKGKRPHQQEGITGLSAKDLDHAFDDLLKEASNPAPLASFDGVLYDAPPPLKSDFIDGDLMITSNLDAMGLESPIGNNNYTDSLDSTVVAVAGQTNLQNVLYEESDTVIRTSKDPLIHVFGSSGEKGPKVVDINANNFTPTLPHRLQSSSKIGAPAVTRTKKFKIHLADEIFLLTITFPIAFDDLLVKIQDRVSSPAGSFKIKYKDEEGDFVTVGGDQDLLEYMNQAEFETSNVLHFYISII